MKYTAIALSLAATVVIAPAAASKRIAGAGCGTLRETASLTLTIPVDAGAVSPQDALAKLETKLKEVQIWAKDMEKVAVQSQSYSISQPQAGNVTGQLSVSLTVPSAADAWTLAEMMVGKNYNVNLNVSAYRDGNCFSGGGDVILD